MSLIRTVYGVWWLGRVLNGTGGYGEWSSINMLENFAESHLPNHSPRLEIRTVRISILIVRIKYVLIRSSSLGSDQ